jgi:imidazole glycerol phosphate synthase glutamine amidotransferase subunit
MSLHEVIVVRTGAANLASVEAGLRRCGAEPKLSDTPAEVAAANRLVLPGVGSFGKVMERLQNLGLTEILAQRARYGRPTLAICLGLQLLAAGSDESPGVAGLGVLPVRATRFNGGVRVPQLGWNQVAVEPGCRLLKSGIAYFANSYCLAEAPDGWNIAWSEHGTRFVAAIERGAVLGCQLHPELSGAWGQALLQRWLETTEVLPC